MFNFAAYLGALYHRDSISLSILGAFIAYFGIFAPGLMMMTILVPIWEYVRGRKAFKNVFDSVNASAIGLIYAAVYSLCLKAIVINGIGESIFNHPFFINVAIAAFVLNGFLNVSSPFVIFLGGLAGSLLFYTIVSGM